MLIDQLKEIYIAGELDIVETANWNPKVTRQDYMVGLKTPAARSSTTPTSNSTRVMPAIRTATLPATAIAELENLFHRQSRETDQEKRKELVWDIDTTLQRGGRAAGHLSHTRATCWQPQVKGLTTMVNSMYNGWRMEDVWLDK